jgi:MbtH protein
MPQSETNPFENEAGIYCVLINDEGQHSLWPDFVAVPAGWHTAFGPGSRAECLSFIATSWQDLRPASLIHASLGRPRASQPSTRVRTP